MLVIRLKPTERAVRYCKRDNIELIRVQAVLNFIAQYIDHRKKIEIVTPGVRFDGEKSQEQKNKL